MTLYDVCVHMLSYYMCVINNVCVCVCFKINLSLDVHNSQRLYIATVNQRNDSTQKAKWGGNKL